MGFSQEFLVARAFAEVQLSRLSNIGEEFLVGFTLGKDAFANPSRTPEVSVTVDLESYDHTLASVFSARGRTRGLSNRLNPVGIHIDQLMLRQQLLYPGPYPAKKRVKVSPSHVPDSQMHYPWRRRRNQNAAAEIGVLRDDSVSLFPGMFPY